jgi:hypothetical protein
MENLEGYKEEKALGRLIDIIGKTGSFLIENDARMTDKKIVIERNENGYLQATVVISLEP